MSLIVKPPNWGYYTGNQPSTPIVTGAGQVITAGANNDPTGTEEAAVAALTHDVEYLIVSCAWAASATITNTLAHILIDPAGGTSWSVLIPDLLAGYCNASAPRVYHFPIWIPAGATLGVSAQTAEVAPRDGQVAIHAFGGNQNPGSWWAGTKVHAIGTVPASSRGQNHTPGNSGAFSSWTSLGSPVAQRFGNVQLATQGNNAVTVSSLAWHWQLGVASLQIGPSIYVFGSTSESCQALTPGPAFCSVPASTQLQVRATCNGTSPANMDCAAYGVS